MQSNQSKLNIPVFVLVILLVIGAIDCGLRFISSSKFVAGINNPLLQYPNLFLGTSYWKLKPNLHQEVKNAPTSFTIDTNSNGLRMEDFSIVKPEGKIRTAIMGDSVAFGWGLPAEEAFPAVLQQRLGEKYEVLNFAGPEYTSFHGLKQYEELVHNVNPDILVLAFGLYDSFESKLSEEEYYTLFTQSGLSKSLHGLAGLLDHSSYLYHWWTTRKREQATHKFAQILQEKKIAPAWKRKVSNKNFEENLRLIIDHLKSQGGKTILLNVNLLNYDTLPVLESLSQSLSVPLLDVRAYFDQIGQYQSRETRNENDLDRPGLHPAKNEKTYLFRVAVPTGTQYTQPLYIAGNHEKLGNGDFNQTRLYDDGTHGDERKYDGIWSLELEMDIQHPVYYTFTDAISIEAPDEVAKFNNTLQNNTFYWRIKPNPVEDNYERILPVATLHKIPFSQLLLTETTPFPNRLGQASIASRLEKIILDVSQN